MFRLNSPRSPLSTLAIFTTLLAAATLTGCGMGNPATGDNFSGVGTASMTGKIHGGPNPISNAAITLYTTTSAGYGATATVVATTTTNTTGDFLLTLPTATIACPAGQYAYIGAYGGNTGAGTNTDSLLMVPIGACATNFTNSGSVGNYTNTYTGPTLWINELTTAVSAYALGNFTTIGTGGVINIGAPANNFATASIGSSSASPSAAGLAHAFANALAIMSISNGQPNAYTNGGTSASTGGVVPQAEIYLLANILQSCVNTTGTTGSNTAASNDGTNCGKLFSLTTPPQTGATVPGNTLQAMIDLAKYPLPSVNTWNGSCTAAGSGTGTAVNCLYNLAAPQSPYAGALAAAPPDFALAIVYTSGYGSESTLAGCTGTCPGLTYPVYTALDYQDNVYVLNYDSAPSGTLPQAAPNWTSIIGISNSGAPIFASTESTSKSISMIATDLAGHIIAPQAVNLNPASVYSYSATNGSLLATMSYNNYQPMFAIVDPFNNVYVSSYIESINLRRFVYSGTSSAPTYSAPTTYSAYSIITDGAPYQMAFDSNLDIVSFLDPAYGGTGSPYICLMNNQSSTAYTYMSAAPSTAYTFCTTGSSTAIVEPGNTGSAVIAAGIAPTSTGLLSIGSSGMTKVTKSAASKTATLTLNSTTTIPAVNSVLYSRYVSVDGNDWGYSVDGANGQVSGVSVFDATDVLALGTYKGCFVTPSLTCGATNSAGSTQAPMASPRNAGIDSSGDIWVISGNTASLTELIGAAAPTWPGLSMAKFGQPQ